MTGAPWVGLAVEDGIVWSPRTGPWLWLTVDPLHVDGLTEDEMVAAMRRLEGVLHTLTEGEEGRLLVTEEPASIVPAPYQHGVPLPAWDRYLAAEYAHTAARQHRVRACYLAVRLTPSSARPSGLASKIGRALGFLAGDEASRDEYRTRASLLQARLAGAGLALVPAPADTLARLVARPMWLGIDRTRTRPSGVIEPRTYYAVKTVQEQGEAWVASLVVDDLRMSPFPAGAWLLPRPDLGFPVDISIGFDMIPAAEQAKLLAGINERVADQIRNITGGTERDDDPSVSIDLAEQLERTRELEHDVRTTRRPWVHPQITVTIAAATRDMLDQRVERTVGSYASLGVSLLRPGPDQWRLLRQQTPAARWEVRDWTRQMPATTLAAGLPHGTVRLGMGTGVYLGPTTHVSETAVHLDLIGLARADIASTVLVTGEPGSAKSATAKRLLAECAMRGATVAVLDPQREYDAWRDYLTRAGVATQRLRFGDTTPGALDPWLVHRADRGAAAALAVELAVLMLPATAGTMIETHITVAARDASSMTDLMGRLRAHPSGEVAASGEALAAYAEHPLARLFFPAGPAFPVTITEAVTVLQWEGLDLAADGQPRTAGQRLSGAVLHATAALIGFLLARHGRPGPKVLAFDEAHQLTGSPAGRRQVSLVTKGGRKVDLTTVLITQNAEHLGDPAILNNARLALCFRSGDPAEQQGVSRVLRRGRPVDGGGWEGDPQIMDRLGRLATGECLLRDPSGRVGSVQVDHWDMDLFAAARTTPGDELASDPVTAGGIL